MAEPLEQLEVGVHGRLGLCLVEGVLAEVVERDVQALLDEVVRRRDRVVGALTGHEPGDDAAAHRQPRDDVLDLVAPGQQQQCLSQHRDPPCGNRVRPTVPPGRVRPEICARLRPRSDQEWPRPGRRHVGTPAVGGRIAQDAYPVMPGAAAPRLDCSPGPQVRDLRVTSRHCGCPERSREVVQVRVARRGVRVVGHEPVGEAACPAPRVCPGHVGRRERRVGQRLPVDRVGTRLVGEQERRADLGRDRAASDRRRQRPLLRSRRLRPPRDVDGGQDTGHEVRERRRVDSGLQVPGAAVTACVRTLHRERGRPACHRLVEPRRPTSRSPS